MDVKTVCLGMLSSGEASGYDLKKNFESSFAHFFAAGFGSIYPALASLSENGLVSCEEIPQDGKPDRKVYRITPAGRQHLLEQLDNPAPTHKIRSEFLATMAFAHLMTPQQIETVLDSLIEDADRNLALIDEYETKCEGECSAGVRFTLEFGRTMLRTMQNYVTSQRPMFADAVSGEEKSAVA
jgi:DNA-binding PadR family transcriptional regulator